MPTETTYVFLDTEIFDRHHLDLSSPSFKRLIRLAEADELKLISTDVTMSEVKSHIDKFAARAIKQLSDYRKVNRVVRGFLSPEQVQGLEAVSQESLATNLQGELSRFITVTGAEVLSIDKVSPASIFEKYFLAEPPFNTTNKKVEFPDAFASAALEAWCNVPPGKRLYVVSGDPDWRRLCEATTGFIYVRQLEQLLEIFADSELAADLKEALTSSDTLEPLLTKQIEDGRIYFYVDDIAIDGEVEEIEDVDIEVGPAYVVEANANAATLVITCILKVALFVRADDPDSVYRDPDDGDLRSVWTAVCFRQACMKLFVGG